jgi:polar amino acid transport system substrate-binding protein
MRTISCKRGGNFIARMVAIALVALCVPVLPAIAADTCKHLVVSGNPEYPPYLWRDPADESRLTGANAELMQLLANELGITIDMVYGGPWGRVQEDVRNGRIDAIAGAFFTLPRLQYMDYFYPAFQGTRTVIWTRDDNKLAYKRWVDLEPLKGVTVINNSFGEAFDRFAKERLKITSVPNLEQALRMLKAGRADYLIYEDNPGQAYAARYKITGLKTVLPAISNENLYITLSHKSACNTGEFRGRLSAALYKLMQQKVMPRLIETNIQRWQNQQSN